MLHLTHELICRSLGRMAFYIHPLETAANFAGAILKNADCRQGRDNRDSESGLNGPDGFDYNPQISDATTEGR